MFELNREHGSTLVLVTHDPSIAARCGRVITIEAGRALRVVVRATADNLQNDVRCWLALRCLAPMDTVANELLEPRVGEQQRRQCLFHGSAAHLSRVTGRLARSACRCLPDLDRQFVADRFQRLRLASVPGGPRERLRRMMLGPELLQMRLRQAAGADKDFDRAFALVRLRLALGQLRADADRGFQVIAARMWIIRRTGAHIFGDRLRCLHQNATGNILRRRHLQLLQRLVELTEPFNFDLDGHQSALATQSNSLTTRRPSSRISRMSQLRPS
eukprot:gene32600-40228_t